MFRIFKLFSNRFVSLLQNPELSDSDSCAEPEPNRELYFLPTDGKVYYQSPESPASSMSSSCSSTTPHRAPRPKPPVPNTQRFSDLTNDISDEEFCIIDEPGLGNKVRAPLDFSNVIISTLDMLRLLHCLVAEIIFKVSYMRRLV